MIDLDRVTYSYRPGDTDMPPALRGLSLQVPSGQFVAVIGRNGSGKSTLLKLLTALAFPTEGTVRVDGLVSVPSTQWDIRALVAPVFQDPDDEIVATRVADDVAFGPENLQLSREEISRRVDWALEVVHLSDRREALTQNLSTAEKQRLAIADALAMKPRVLVLDEPSAYVPSPSAARLLATLARLNRDLGVTVLYITHIMAEAAAFDRVLVLDRGDLVLDGPPRDVFEEGELLRGLGLETPPVVRLASQLQAAGITLPRIPLDGIELACDLGAVHS